MTFRTGEDGVEHGRVLPDPSAWLGTKMTPAWRKRVSRSYVRLEQMGLIERWLSRSGRTHSLALTDLGHQVIEYLAEDN